MNEQMNYNKILSEAKKIASNPNFIEYVNKRECETEIAKLENLIDIDTELDEMLCEYIGKNATLENEMCYVIFQLLFTIYRRKRYGNLEEYVNKYIGFFRQYPFTEFIELLMIYKGKAGAS